MNPCSHLSSVTKLFLADWRRGTFLLGFLIAIATFGVYWQVHTHPFLEGDDYFYVVDNLYVHSGLNWGTVRWAFTTLQMVNWIPLIWLLHTLDYQLFGVSPAGHHIVNVLFHALNASLLFWVLKRATNSTARSLMVAALFALHPINVEAVVWVAELKTMLSTTFLLFALAAYRRYAQEPRLNRYLVVALMFSLALMSKPQVIMFPLALLLWDYWPLQRISLAIQESDGEEGYATAYPRKSFRRLIMEKLPLFALAAADGLVTLKVQGASPRYWLTTHSLAVRVDNAIVCYARYIGKALWPASLALGYPHPGSSLKAWEVSGALVLLAVVTGLVLLGRRRRYLPMGWFWFVLNLLPMIGLIQVGSQAMADRYAYDSYLGLFIMASWGAADYAKKFHTSASWLSCASAAAIVALTMVTCRQIGYWRDTLTLLVHTTQVVKNDWKGEDNVADELLRQGDPAAAMQHYYRANAINPDDAWSNEQIGFFEQTRGNPQSAILHYRRALRANNIPPETRALLWRNLGVAYRAIGDLAEEREYLEKSTRSAVH